MTFSKDAIQAANALKSIARNEQIKAYIQHSNELYPLLLKAAKRFVAGETREEGIKKAKELMSKGYRFSLEYIGENTRNLEECQKSKEEFLSLIKEVGVFSQESTVSFDLSHIGLSLDPELAYDNVCQLAEEAQKYNITLMISMEESAKTHKIIGIYNKAVKKYSNIGLTIQAYLYRSDEDIRELLNYPGKIRLVKGAYQEPSEIAIPRTEILNQRYISLLTTLIEANHPVSIATHDEEIIQQIIDRKLLNKGQVEVEMLYGIRADLLKALKEKGYKTRVYLTYGTEWYLYLCHRIAEYPPNLYSAVTNIITEEGIKDNIY